MQLVLGDLVGLAAAPREEPAAPTAPFWGTGRRLWLGPDWRQGHRHGWPCRVREGCRPAAREDVAGCQPSTDGGKGDKQFSGVFNIIIKFIPSRTDALPSFSTGLIPRGTWEVCRSLDLNCKTVRVVQLFPDSVRLKLHWLCFQRRADATASRAYIWHEYC